MTPRKPKRPKLLLLDGHSLAFRAFYALPEDLQTTDGTFTNAVYGFTSMLIKLMQEQRPDYITSCFDAGGPLERTEQFSDYKATRTEAPETFSPQLPLIHEVLKVLHIPVFMLTGHEADDLISYFSRCAAAEGVDVRIVTGDRDFFQLVDDDIKVLYNRRGISDIVEMNARAVEERYGVPPSRYLDLKALEGDTTDNLPGVPGVGTKTAARLVQTYGSAEAAIEHAGEQTPRLAKNLAEHAEQVILNKKLATLVEVPLDAGLNDMKMGAWDLEEVRELFTSLEFRTLLERLLSDMPEAAEGEGTPFDLELQVCSDLRSLGALAERLLEAGEVSVDLVPSTPRGGPRSLAFSWGEGEVAFVPIGPHGVSGAEVTAALKDVFEDPSVTKIAHGGRQLFLSLFAVDIGLDALRFDTHVASYLLDPAATGYPIDEVARKYTGRELRAVQPVERPEEGPQAALDLDGAEPDEGEAEDASLRALAIHEISEAVGPELDRLGMTDLYRDIEHPLVEVLARMELFGVRIDLEYLNEMARDLDKRIGALEAECYELAGERVNLGSPQQLRALLYDKLGLKTTRRTKTGKSTDARALQQLVGQHPFVQKLLDYRELAKLKNTYIDALPPLVDPGDGRVHTTYDQTATTTGRLSSTNPNLQNIPVRTDLGKQIRRAFLPEPGHLLLSADYSQIELRVMAHLSEDPILLAVFQQREDVHAATAARIFGLDPGDLKTRHRSAAKMVNYGLSYGMGASGLAERLNVPVAEARNVMDAYFEQFGGVKTFLDDIVKHAHADGFTTTMFGRRRYLPELGSGNPRVRAIGERQALNAPIQGSAADIMKLAMIGVDRALETKQVESKMILTVHDELVFEVPEDEREVAAELVERHMTSVCDMKVPLEVDVSFGRSWAEAKD